MFDITSKALMWIAGALFVLLIVATGFAGCEHHNAGAARARADALEIAVDNAVDANKTNLATIATYKKANAALWALIPKAQDVVKQLAELQRQLNELNARDAAYARAKETDRADPDCDALLRTDLGRVCPTVARSLRRSAGGD